MPQDKDKDNKSMMGSAHAATPNPPGGQQSGGAEAVTVGPLDGEKKPTPPVVPPQQSDVNAGKREPTKESEASKREDGSVVPDYVKEFKQSSGLWVINKTGGPVTLVRQKWDGQAKEWANESRLVLAAQDGTEIEVGDGVRTAVG